MQISGALLRKTPPSTLQSCVALYHCSCCVWAACHRAAWRLGLGSLLFPPSLRSEILLLCRDWTLTVCENTQCQIFSVSLIDWGLGQTVVYFHAALLLESKMAFRKKMRESWGHLWVCQLWNGRWLLQGQKQCSYLGMCWGKYFLAPVFLSRRNFQLLLALFVLMKLSEWELSLYWCL